MLSNSTVEKLKANANYFMSCRKKITTFSFLVLLFVVTKGKTQAVLEANGPGNTYELINSVLAPGYTSVEAPDQCASHPAFGRHVAEVFDAILNQFVFEFYMHVPASFPAIETSADNDRCLNFDRQRVEIKTYESSPSSLKGTVGETVTYKWKFRLPNGFQPSPNFTHIHQIKAVGGDDDDPIFTLTPRYSGSGNTLQLIYVSSTAASNTYLATAPLSSFLGVWVEVTEQIKVGANGTYSISIKRVSDGVALLSYSSSNILTIRADNNFIRPKWGIYRSLNAPTYLRDDSIRIASISIFEGLPPEAPANFTATAISTSQINLAWSDNSTNETAFVIERSNDGLTGWNNIYTSSANATAYSNTGLTPNTTYYYRIRSENPAGISTYSTVINAKTFQALPAVLSNFKATLQHPFANLNWKTFNEINLATYQVEWSNNAINYTTIALIAAKGNGVSSQLFEYSFQHKNLAEHNYYRLKMVDHDGAYQYSPVQLISIGKATIIQIYPNPAKNFLTIELDKSTNIPVEVGVIDATGKQLMQVKFLGTRYQLNLKNISAGLYTLQLSEAGIVIARKKMIISAK